jgi:hypothetical protein
MPKASIPFAADDVSALALSLRRQLADCGHVPGHVEFLNMLARAVGRRNFQHLRAQAVAHDRLGRVVPPSPPVDHRRVMRTSRHFDERGRLVRWPGKASERQLCLWALWSRIPARTVFTEPQVNAMLDAGHLFGDYAVLRRGLCDDGLVSRTIDGREYRRVERRPPVEAAALIGHLKLRLG